MEIKNNQQYQYNIITGILLEIKNDFSLIFIRYTGIIYSYFKNEYNELIILFDEFINNYNLWIFNLDLYKINLINKIYYISNILGELIININNNIFYYLHDNNQLIDKNDAFRFINDLCLIIQKISNINLTNNLNNLNNINNMNNLNNMNNINSFNNLNNMNNINSFNNLNNLQSNNYFTDISSIKIIHKPNNFSPSDSLDSYELDKSADSKSSSNEMKMDIDMIENEYISDSFTIGFNIEITQNPSWLLNTDYFSDQEDKNFNEIQRHKFKLKSNYYLKKISEKRKVFNLKKNKERKVKINFLESFISI